MNLALSPIHTYRRPQCGTEILPTTVVHNGLEQIRNGLYERTVGKGGLRTQYGSKLHYESLLTLYSPQPLRTKFPFRIEVAGKYELGLKQRTF